jgi:hypothetical protein
MVKENSALLKFKRFFSGNKQIESYPENSRRKMAGTEKMSLKRVTNRLKGR